MDVARTCYEDAIKWFEKVATGKFNPGLPMPVDDSETDYNENDSIQWDSEEKRNNHW
jgi:phage gp36-like protein